MASYTFSGVWVSATLLRLALLLYSEWHDKRMHVAYTDVDYLVYTDAAKHVLDGRSPFDRDTFRYTPLLAYLMVPCHTLFMGFGKVLFAFADLLLGWFIYRILLLRSVDHRTALLSACTWLFNPLSFAVSTRGNADVLVCLMVIATLYLFLLRQLVLGSIMFGFAVHFKIYPIIYAFALLVFIDHIFEKRDAPTNFLGMLINVSRIKLFLISASVFFSLLAFFYYLYGWTFLYETYLYHLVRRDNRHNFSVYFYHLYLEYDSLSSLAGLWSFGPQLVTIIFAALALGHDLPFCFFVQTVIFVVFNKVATAQYFTWYFSILPLILPSTSLGLFKGAALAIVWFAGELHWLFWAYQIEIQSRSAFLMVWTAGIAFFWINVYVLSSIIRHHRYTPTLEKSGIAPLPAPKQKPL